MKILEKIIGFLRRPPLRDKYHYHTRKNDPAIDIARLAKWDAELVPLLRHSNGYVRQAAVKRAGKLLLPILLRYLMERINDWVPQVRASAHAAVEAYLDADRFDDFLSALPNIYWLRECSRADHEPFIGRIEEFLATHARKAEIAPRIAWLNDIYARSHFDLASKYRLADTSQLISYGLQSSDWPTLRNACRMIDRLPVAEQLAFSRLLLQKKTGWLVTEGLRIVLLNDGAAAREAALPYLMSGYAPLRQFAERLSGRTEEELSMLRHNVLADAQTQPAALLVAIRLCGNLKDLTAEGMIERFMLHANPKLRGTALLALTRLSPQKFASLVIPALDDAEPVVAREAARAFKELNLSMEPPEWAARAENGGTEGHFRRIVHLAHMRNKWDHLGVLLEYSAREKFAQAVKQGLEVWCSQFNRSFVPATAAQRAWISNNLARYKGKSPSAADLAFYCR